MSEKQNECEKGATGLFSELLEKEEFRLFIERNCSGEKKEFLKNSLELMIHGYQREEKLQNGDGIRTVPLEHLKLHDMLAFDCDSAKDENELLQNLYRLGASFAIDKITGILEHPSVSSLFFRLRMVDVNSKYDELKEYFEYCFEKNKVKETKKLADELFSWIKILKAFCIDKSPNGENENPAFSIPFGRADTEDKKWQNIIDISSNFGHALKRVFNAEAFFNYINELSGTDTGNDPEYKEYKHELFAGCAKYLHYQSGAVKGFLKLLQGYKFELLKFEKQENINDWHPIFNDINKMLNARSLSNSDSVIPLPISFPAEEDGRNKIALKNVDKNKLIRALFELAKNAFNEEKVKEDELKKFLALGRAYLEVNITTINKDEKEMVCISFTDRGKPIAEKDLEEKFGREIRGAEDIMNILSTHGTSVLGSRESEGIGLFEARSIVRGHNGDLLCRNSESGVKFSVLIPKEGKKSPYRLRFGRGELKIVSEDDIHNRRTKTQETLNEIIKGRYRSRPKPRSRLGYKPEPRS